MIKNVLKIHAMLKMRLWASNKVKIGHGLKIPVV